MEGLTPGRIVHYVEEAVIPQKDADNIHSAALVVAVEGEAGHAHLLTYFVQCEPPTLPNAPLNPSDILQIPRFSVPYSSEKLPGTWHWIER